MKPIIRAENVGKKYRLGAKRDAYGSLRESLMRAARSPLRRLFGKQKPTRETIWALEDVSFEVQPGAVVGVIGRNGAGKSTLLKILSRITEPTTGRIELRGRVGSLLEVGTGFHPELTGRENIYLNGSILGMSRSEIEKKFNEIVDFSEIARFLDTPVKRYSSGMYVRLAFAVAAHLDPEILLVDEVLAVGDAQFQKKCLGKMKDFSHHGRTVLFVSHNMAAVSSLCEKAVWLSQGNIVGNGPVQRIVREYLTAGLGHTLTGRRELSELPRDGQCDKKVKFVGIELRNSSGDTTSQFLSGEPFELTIEMESEIHVCGEVGYTIKTMEGVPLFSSSSNDSGKLLDIEPGTFVIRTALNPNYLRPGRYIIQLGTTCIICRDFLPEAIEFEIVADQHFSSGSLYQLPGHFYFPYSWRSSKQLSECI